MLQIDFSLNGFKYKSVRKHDLNKLEKWLKENIEDDNINFSLDNQIFYRRFLEYYIADNECFMEIYHNGKLIGTFKGRLECSNNKKLVIWFFIMDRQKRNEGFGSKVVQDILKYFKNQYNISNIEVGVVENNLEGIAFWDSMGFDVTRITKNFFDSRNTKESNLVIMEKIA